LYWSRFLSQQKDISSIALTQNMHQRWLSLPLLTTSVAAFYPIREDQGSDTNDKNKRFYPAQPLQDTGDDTGVYTLDLKKIPRKRQNAFNINESDNPDEPHALAIHQDGSDFSYFSTLRFGSSAQEMHMLIDTGSTNTWVFGSDCKSDSCSIHNTFGKSDSSTLSTTTQPFDLAYGTGKVEGTMAEDKVAFANYTLELEFGLVKTASDDFNNYPFDGILGLGPASSNDLGAQTVMQALDQQAGLKNNILGVHLQRASDDAKDGQLTIGGLDNDKFRGDISYTKTKSSSGWEINIDDVFVGGQACKFTSKSALIDTGTSYALMPPSDAKALHALIPGSANSGESYTVPCDATTTVEVSISRVKYAISPKDYVGKRSSANTCASNIIGHQPFGPNQWILGDVFLKNVYAVFDFDQDRIGKSLTIPHPSVQPPSLPPQVANSSNQQDSAPCPAKAAQHHHLPPPQQAPASPRPRARPARSQQ
jgi:cathepsin D